MADFKVGRNVLLNKSLSEESIKLFFFQIKQLSEYEKQRTFQPMPPKIRKTKKKVPHWKDFRKPTNLQSKLKYAEVCKDWVLAQLRDNQIRMMSKPCTSPYLNDENESDEPEETEEKIEKQTETETESRLVLDAAFCKTVDAHPQMDVACFVCQKNILSNHVHHCLTHPYSPTNWSPICDKCLGYFPENKLDLNWSLWVPPVK